MRGVLVILVAGLACSTQGGTITSGSFSLNTPGSASGTFSGENFAATVFDNSDVDPLGLSSRSFPPFQAPIPNAITWPGDYRSSVLYNGFLYSVPFPLDPPQGKPFATVSFTEDLISPRPIVTGPGTYSLDLFSVTLSFTLVDASHTIFYRETDTGFATGSITYTGDTTFVSTRGFEATIIPEPIPEPSTWSSMAMAACFLGAFAGIRLRRQLPGHRFQEQ